MNFDKLSYESDYLKIDNFTFSLGSQKSDSCEDCFILWKDKGLIGQYKEFFSSYDKSITNVLELGLWQGGSTVFWSEVLEPKKVVGLDNSGNADSDYFKKWLLSKSNIDVKTYWSIDQDSKDQLENIISKEFNNEPIDIVIDDASHLLSLTNQSIQNILPYVRSGGLYIIEDWAWYHWKDCVYKFPHGEGLSSLVYKIIQMVGSYTDVIRSVKVYPGFAVLERGYKEIDNNLKLDDHIFLPDYDLENN